jgi:DNA-binding NarL/FixJ family response regulator
MPHRHRVLVVDDHPLIRRGLQVALSCEEDIEIIGEAIDGEDALRAVRERQPDVVLLDLALPKLGGIEVIAAIKRVAPDARILVLTGLGKQAAELAIECGAHRALSKSLAPREIAHEIRGRDEQPSIVGIDESPMLGLTSEERAKIEGLTARQLQVLALLARGLTSDRIGVELGCSSGTVKAHIEHVLERLNLPDRMSAAVLGRRAGLASDRRT